MGLVVENKISGLTTVQDTWTTALSNSLKLSHAVWGHPGQTAHGGEG